MQCNKCLSTDLKKICIQLGTERALMTMMKISRYDNFLFLPLFSRRNTRYVALSPPPWPDWRQRRMLVTNNCLNNFLPVLLTCEQLSCLAFVHECQTPTAVSRCQKYLRLVVNESAFGISSSFSISLFLTIQIEQHEKQFICNVIHFSFKTATLMSSITEHASGALIANCQATCAGNAKLDWSSHLITRIGGDHELSSKYSIGQHLTG